MIAAASKSPPSEHALDAALRRDDELLVQNDAHLAAEQFEENSNAVAIADALEQAETIGENALAHAHFVAGGELRPPLELNETLRVLAAFQTVNDGIVDRGRRLAIAHQPRDADG